MVYEKEKGTEKLARLVEATYHTASTFVRTTHGRTDMFPIKVGLHQGSGLRPFLFIVVLDIISEEFSCNGRPYSCKSWFGIIEPVGSALD